MKTRYALITGGSCGIGLELARLFCMEQIHCILVSRSEEHLKQAKKELESIGGHVEIIAMDLSLENSAKDLYDIITNKHIHIDLLINNAGIGYTGEFIHMSESYLANMLELNVVTLSKLTYLFAKDMIGLENQEIINISSTGAFQSGPYIASYYASKAYVDSFTQALFEEMKPYHIKVHAFTFGPVASDFYKNCGLKTPKYAMDVKKACAYCMKKRNSKQCVIIPGFLNRLACIFPRSWKTYFVKRSKKKCIQKYIK